MKKLLLLTLGFYLSLPSKAQYKCIPHLETHGNPGSTMNNDFPGTFEDMGVGYSLTPSWSSVIHLDFPFYFNGQLVTAFKASTTGIVTFDTTVVTVPSPGHVSLPNAQVPNKSICIAGIYATDSASALEHSTEINYSTPAQNRQCWISFLNYTDTTVASSYRFTNWAIVLEENTNNIYIVDESTSNISHPSLTLGIQVNNSTAYMAPGSPSIASHAGYNGYSSNNLYYTFIYGSVLVSDGTVLSTTLQNYLQIGSAPYTIGAKFSNIGTDTIHSLRLNYKINNGSAISQTFSGLTIPCGATRLFNFTSSWNPADTGVYQLNIWADNLSTGVDGDLMNDHFLQRIYVAPALPHRKVMFEEFKGTWNALSGILTEKYDSLLGANSTKISSVKYDDIFNEPWSSGDALTRSDNYHLWVIPSGYANGQMLQSDSVSSADLSVYPGSPLNATQSLIDSLYNLPGLYYINPQLELDGYTANVSGTVRSAVSFPSGTNCKLYVAIVQDTVSFLGPQGNSGETVFRNTEWKFIPDVDGITLGSPKTGDIDSLKLSFFISDPTVDLSRLRVVAFIQDSLTHEIYQCGEAPATQLCIPTTNTTTFDICGDDSILLDGNWIRQSGNYPSLYAAANGCDSLQVNKVIVHTMTCSIIEFSGQYQLGSSSFLNNDTVHYSWYDYTHQQVITNDTTLYLSPVTPGMYAMVMYNQMGCSALSNVLNFHCSPDSSEQFVSICPGDSIHAGNTWLKNRGDQTVTTLNSSGCDSVILVHVTLYTVNDSISVNGFQLSVPAGSASYQWYNCLIGTPIAGDTTASIAADSINGGNYSCLVTSSNGCSEFSSCFHFTNCTPITITSYPSICSNNSFHVGNHFYTLAGTYVDTLVSESGCDSIVTSIVTVFQVSAATDTVYICDGSAYTPPGGIPQTAPGTFITHIPNTIGCDSTITTRLFVNANSAAASVHRTICNGSSYIPPGGVPETTPGTYISDTLNWLGCDSTIITFLSVTMIDTLLTTNTDTLIANPNYTAYNWIDCHSGLPIAGGMGNIFVAVSSGTYGAVIHEASGCIAHSECEQILITSLESALMNSDVEVFPNPASVFTQLVFSNYIRRSRAEIIDLNGRILRSFELNSNPVTMIALDDLASGIFYLKIYQTTELISVKMLSVIK